MGINKDLGFSIKDGSNNITLHSIGKDSSVMLRLAQKAFYPGKIPEQNEN